MLEVPEVRKELQNTWDNIEALKLKAEQDGLGAYLPKAPNYFVISSEVAQRYFRTGDVSQTEVSRSGHQPPQPAAGGYATHWRDISGV